MCFAERSGFGLNALLALWIVSATIGRATPEYSKYGSTSAISPSVLFNGLKCVIGTAGLEATGAPYKRRREPLIAFNETN